MSWESEIKATALYDFNAQPGSGELSIVAGDTLTITRQDVGEGWWEGINNKGETGLFPEGYVEILTNAPPPSQQKMPPIPIPAPIAPVPNPIPGGYDPSAADPDGGWDEEWDDDDSQASTTGGDNYQQSLGGTQNYGSQQIGNNAGQPQKTVAVKKSFNRFSTFVKSGGEDYILGTKTKSAPVESHVYVTESTPGQVSWALNAHPYNCFMASPKKESKLKGLKSYIAYSLTPSFNNIQVSRRYKHFDWLQGRLEEKFMTIPIPPLPDKQISGRYQEDFIRHRLNQLQLWVNRICRHPVLSQCDVWMHFLTCTDEKRWKVGKRRAEKDDFTGASFFFAIQPPGNPLEVVAVEKKTEKFGRFAARMDDSVKNLYATVQDQSRKYSGPYKSELSRVSKSFLQLSDSFAQSGYDQEDGALNQALRHTSTTYENISKLYDEQPRYDLEPLSDALYEYKGLLANWPDILQVHKGALNRKKEHMRLPNEGGKSVAQRADIVSYSVLAEMDYFQHERVADFKLMMQNFIRGQIDFYEKIVAELKTNLDKYD